MPGQIFRCFFFPTRLLPLLFLTLLFGCSDANRVEIQVNNVNAWVELAATPEGRRQGLMGRDVLGRDEGMLLVFPDERIIEMWMLNTEIPLDVGFFDRSGRLLQWLTMLPDGGKRIYASPAPALYALEMNRGWFQRFGLRPGAQLHLPEPVVGK